MLLRYLGNKDVSEMLCFLNFLLRGMLYDLLQPCPNLLHDKIKTVPQDKGLHVLCIVKKHYSCSK